ncbi:MAG: hypothetical protein AB8B73_09600 [Ekhidna sp.]
MKMHPTLHRIKKNWELRIYLKVVALLLFSSGFIFGLTWLLSLNYLVIFVMGVLSILISIRELKRKPKKKDIIKLVNNQFHSTEYSTELVFEDSVQGITSLQKEKVLSVLEKRIPSLQFPINWKPLFWVFLAGSLILISLFLLPKTIEEQGSYINTTFTLDQVQVISDTAYIKDGHVMVSPPSYTGLRTTQSPLDLEVLNQSSLKWNVFFEGNPSAVWIKTSQGDSLSLRKVDERWSTRHRPKESGFYSLVYQVKDQVISSPYYQLKLLPDEAPEARISGIPQHQRLDYERNLEVNFNVSISDDFGLTDGYMVATITKGSGESVMFREQKIPLPMKVDGKKVIVPMTFRLDDFGMEPGNELYFYATAFDNRRPMVQQSRTETYFFILKDTAQVEFSLQGALGVDLMPDFFRSQLQIIIDTEKLIEDKSRLKKKDFNFTSNELGFDQKQLRLKYGQFIGEEDESGLDIEQEAPEEIGEVESDGSNVLQEFGHDHDHENEEGQHMDKGTIAIEEEKSKNPLQEYMHEHGDEETATFHTQTLKAKLRAALTEMWDAELYLRLFQPEKSLPYQYRAQELLKEIKNHARIYVQRIGFDPPPVNEAESRLTGKMKQLNEGSFQENQEQERSYPSIRLSISTLDEVLISMLWSEVDKNRLEDAGNELAGLAIEQSGEYLEALNVLRILLDKEELNDGDIQALKGLKSVLEMVVLDTSPLPAGDQHTMDEMNTHFLKNLLKANESRK